ncbi:MAG: hypothetical protein H0U95_15690 [Bacteroidetes bacterium]|nr:hypothetical protein [Bacteroidota bacterium]
MAHKTCFYRAMQQALFMGALWIESLNNRFNKFVLESLNVDTTQELTGW